MRSVLNSARSNSLVSAYRIRDTHRKVELLQSSWNQSRQQDKVEYGLESILDGFTVIDLEDLGGIDARNMRAGTLKFEAIVAAPTGTTQVTLIPQTIS